MKKLSAIVLFLCLAAILFAAGTQEATSLPAAWEAQGTPLADVRIRQALRLAIDMENYS